MEPQNIDRRLAGMPDDELRQLYTAACEARREDKDSELGRAFPFVRREVRRRGLKED